MWHLQANTIGLASQRSTLSAEPSFKSVQPSFSWSVVPVLTNWHAISIAPMSTTVCALVIRGTLNTLSQEPALWLALLLLQENTLPILYGPPVNDICRGFSLCSLLILTPFDFPSDQRLERRITDYEGTSAQKSARKTAEGASHFQGKESLQRRCEQKEWVGFERWEETSQVSSHHRREDKNLSLSFRLLVTRKAWRASGEGFQRSLVMHHSQQCS